VTYATSAVEARLYCPDPLYGATVAEGVDEYRALLRELIRDATRRAEVGQAARATVAKADAGWSEAVEDAYALAERLGPMDAGQLAPLPHDGSALDAMIHAGTVLNRGLPPKAADRIADIVELSARSPAVRRLYWWSSSGPGYPQQRGRYVAAFAAPSADPDILTGVIDEFRRLARAGVAASYVLALRPDDAETAVPVLEAALATGEDVDVDLVIDENPESVRPRESLLVAPPGTPADDATLPMRASGSAA
jgi:hypothetical protein